MENRKIYCEVVEGIVWETRCLFKLSKVVEGSKACESCILRQLEEIQSCGIKRAKASPKKKSNVKPKKRGRARLSGKGHSKKIIPAIENPSQEEDANSLDQNDEVSP